MISGKISVLMSVYNAESTLREAIDSVLAQTYDNWQFIICDDCSVDSSYRILREYENNYPGRFIVIRNSNNSKLAFSLNRCLEFADGEYSVRMDADDYIAANKFEKQVKYLVEHPNLQLCGTLMQAFDAKARGEVYEYKEFPDKTDLRYGPVFPHATIMMYTDIYKRIGGYTVSHRTNRTQDYDLWFKFFADGNSGGVLQEVLYYVREDRSALRRRKPKVYLWAVVTRWIGFRRVRMPLKYYPYILMPLFALIKNELKILKAKMKVND